MTVTIATGQAVGTPSEGGKEVARVCDVWQFLCQELIAVVAVAALVAKLAGPV